MRSFVFVHRFLPIFPLNFIMISDETFPIDLLDGEDQCSRLSSADTGVSTETFETSVTSSHNFTNQIDCSFPMSKSLATETNAMSSSADSFIDTQFSSFDTSSSQMALLPPKTPIKLKKFYSCHDIMQSKKNYDHVESKVKKLIQNMNEDDRKRKSLSRHKSMPISTQPPIDDVFNQEKDINVLIKELRKKSVKIYELEEKCDEKDSRIYALEIDKSKMKMTFDKLRLEMHDLKEKEKDYKLLLASSPTNGKNFKHAGVQTEEKLIKLIKNDPRLQNLVIRELTFESEGAAVAANQSLNQTHFSELNNASSDNLIPEIFLDDINATHTIEQHQEEEENESIEQRKKTKNIRNFFRMMSCVSKQ